MSTSILYHGFGVRGYKYIKTEYQAGKIIFHIEKIKEKQVCADCGSRAVIKKGKVKRSLRAVPIGKRPVFFVIHLHRLFCSRCGSLKLEPLILSYPKKHWTKNLGRYIIDLLRHSTVEDIAKHLGMSWGTIKDIHKMALNKRYANTPVRHLRYLGIDEIAVRKGHNYLTVVVDLETGQVIWAAEGRKANSLEPFLEKLKRARAQIKAIAMDMWPAYINTVLKYYPYNLIVFDRYHIISAYNRMLDELRRKEISEAPGIHKGIYAGVRYLLLKGKEKIQDNFTARAKLETLLRLNKTLSIAYILKEELRDLWNCNSRKEASQYLMNWLYKAWSCGIKPVMKFANTIAGYRVGLLNYFDHPITTGMVEGINNKIKVLKRQAYGFRDMDYFKLRIYALNESRYALIG